MGRDIERLGAAFDMSAAIGPQVVDPRGVDVRTAEAGDDQQAAVDALARQRGDPRLTGPGAGGGQQQEFVAVERSTDLAGVRAELLGNALVVGDQRFGIRAADWLRQIAPISHLTLMNTSRGDCRRARWLSDRAGYEHSFRTHRRRSTAPNRPATPRYSLLLSTDPELIDAAQRLRHDVFTSEPGFALPGQRRTVGMPTASTSTATTCWSARTAPARWSAATGCCRRPAPSRPEVFTPQPNSMFSALDALRPSLVEMGRAVVRADHRNGAVVLLMWAGILAYLDRCGYDYVTGCVSVPIAIRRRAPPAARSAGCATSSPAGTPHPRGVHRVPVPAGGARRPDARRDRPAGPAGHSAADARLPAAGRPGVRRTGPRPGLRGRRTSRPCWTSAGPTPATSHGCGRCRPRGETGGA